MATSPQFAIVPVLAAGQVSTPNSNRDGTGALATLITGGTNGTRIERVTMTGTVTTTGGMVRLFVDDLTNKRLYKEISVAAVTPSSTVPAFTSVVSGLGLVLPPGYILKASTENAEAINVTVEGGDL